MKNLKRISLLLVLVSLVISCATMKSNNAVSGKVDSIEAGKDGYTAKISTDAKEVYFATISIVNVGGGAKLQTIKNRGCHFAKRRNLENR